MAEHAVWCVREHDPDAHDEDHVCYGEPIDVPVVKRRTHVTDSRLGYSTELTAVRVGLTEREGSGHPFVLVDGLLDSPFVVAASSARDLAASLDALVNIDRE